MEKPNKIPQLYGYAVCLVAIITFIITVGNLINSLIDMSDPIHAGWNNESAPSLASYENYKMDILKSTAKDADASKLSNISDEKILHKMYEAARTDKIQSEKHKAFKYVMVNSILIIISIIFFITHWKWMRKLLRAGE